MYIGCLGDEILELGWRFGGQGDRGTGGTLVGVGLSLCFEDLLSLGASGQEDVEIGETERGIRVQKRNEKG